MLNQSARRLRSAAPTWRSAAAAVTHYEAVSAVSPVFTMANREFHALAQGHQARATMAIELTKLNQQMRHFVFTAVGDSTHNEETEDEGQEGGDDYSYLELIERARDGKMNWRVGLDILDEIKSADGQGLTVDVATALIDMFATRVRPMECLETLKYSREQNVRPRIQAYSSAIAICYKEQKHTLALRVFEIMRNDGYVPQHVTYSRALSAALKSARHELVLEIFDDMMRHRVNPNIVIYNNILNSCARVGDPHSAMGVLRAIDERGIDLTQSSCHSLAICAGKTGRWELAHEAMTRLKEMGFAPAMPMYNSVIAAYAKGKRWDEIIELYDEMPQAVRDQLHQVYLGGVMMAMAKSNDARIIEIYESRIALGGQDLNLFAHNAVLTYYLNIDQLDKVHEVANDMKARGVELDSLALQNVAIAYIRAGNVSAAEQLLQVHSKTMERSTLCYRELISYYANEKGDVAKACRVMMQMMQCNPRLSRLDWHTALEHSIKLENRAMYWNFRKWMKVRAPGIIDEVPAHLMLPDDAVELRIQRGQRRYQHQHQSKQRHQHHHKQHKDKQQTKRQDPKQDETALFQL